MITMNHHVCFRCGIVSFCSPLSTSENQIPNPNLLIKLSIAQFGLPLLGFILGIMGAYLFHISLPYVADEVLIFCFGVVGLGLCGIISRLWLKRTLPLINEP